MTEGVSAMHQTSMAWRHLHRKDDIWPIVKTHWGKQLGKESNFNSQNWRRKCENKKWNHGIDTAYSGYRENGDIPSESKIGCISGGFVLCAHSVEKTIGKGLVMREGRRRVWLGLPVWSKDEAISGFTWNEKVIDGLRFEGWIESKTAEITIVSRQASSGGW